MKKIFSVFLITVLLLTAIMLTACDGQEDEHVHVYTEEVVAPTCSAIGYTIHTCSECAYVKHDTFVDLDSTVHNYAESETVERTCTEKGYTVFTCVDCGAASYNDKFVNPAHEFTPWTVILEPECPNKGVEQRVCEVCGELEERFIHPQHIWRDSETVVTDPTYENEGYTTYICICGYVDVRDITDRVTTEGLEYKLSEDKKGYILVGGSFEGEILSVPSQCTGIEGEGRRPVIEIRYYAFSGNTDITTVYLSNELSVIGISAFEGCSSLTSIIFVGTMEEWESIVKNNNWDAGTGDYTVYCTDGEITK